MNASLADSSDSSSQYDSSTESDSTNTFNNLEISDISASSEDDFISTESE